MATGGSTGGGGNQGGGGNAPANPAPAAAPDQSPDAVAQALLRAQELRAQLNLEREINLLTESRREELSAALQVETALTKEIQDRLKKVTVQQKNIFDLEKEILEEKLKGVAADEELIKQKEELLKNAKEQQGVVEAEAKMFADKLDNLRKEKELLQARADAIGKERTLSADIAKSTKDQMMSSIGLGTLQNSLNQGMSIGASIQTQLTEQLKKNIGDVLDANRQFAAATGQMSANATLVGSVTNTIGFGYSQFGVGLKEINASMISLFGTMSDFSNLNTETQAKLAGSAAKMANLGVSAETTGKNFDAMTKTLKMSSSEAIATNDLLAKAAIGAGIAPSKMLSEFGPAMSKLSAYGRDGVKVFVDMQKAAKSLGMEMQTLNSIIGDQFDTFEGAANAAGKLNAVLGGDYLNSVEMLNATESERIVLLKKSFDESGRNFDQLSKYEKKAIASALGISDLNEASKLLGKSTVDLQADMQKQAVDQEKLEQVQRQAAETTKSLSAAMDGLLIIAKPIAVGFKNIIEVITAFMDLGGGVPAILLGIAGAVFLLYTNWSLLTSTKSLWIMGLIVAFQLLHKVFLEPNSPILYFALLALPFIIYAIGEAADANEKALLALGAAVALIGAGVYLAATGMAEFVKSFNGLSGPQLAAVAIGLGLFTLMFIGFTAALVALALSGAGLIAVGLMLAFGAAVLLIGAGIALAAVGLSLLIKSIASLADNGAEAAANLFLIGAGVALLVGTLLGIAILGPLGFMAIAAGLGIVTGAIVAINAAIGGADNEKLKNFANAIDGLHKVLLFEQIDTSAKKVVDSIRMIAEEIDKAVGTGDNAVKFSASMTSLNNVLTTAKTIREEEIKPTKDFLQQAKEYYVAQSVSKDASNDALIGMLKELNKAIAQASAANNDRRPMKVKLVVGSKEFEAEMHGLNEKTANLIGN